MNKKAEKKGVIRKLGFFESLCDEEQMHNNLSITTTCLLSIDKTHTLSKEVLTKALKLWVDSHPLLQSRIYRETEPKSSKSTIYTPKYFVKMEQSVEDYKNFEFIDKPLYSFRWNDLVESELKTPVDFLNGPLWRMKLIKIQKIDGYLAKNKDTHNYALIFTVSHSISDGRNSYTVLVQFLDILNACIQNLDVVLSEIRKIPSRFSYEAMVEDMTSKGALKVKREPTNILDSMTHRLPNNVGNKQRGVSANFDFCALDKAKLTRLVETMKLNESRAKLASLLLVLMCLAFKRTCVKYNVNNIPLDKFKVQVPVSVRSKLKLSNLQMGSYVSNLEANVDFGPVVKEPFLRRQIKLVLSSLFYYVLKRFIFPLYFFVLRNVPKFVVSFLQNQRQTDSDPVALTNNRMSAYLDENFWSIVGENSSQLHQRINNNSELDLQKMEFIELLIKNEFDFNTFYPISFTVSNLGIMENTRADSCMRILEAYTCVTCKEKRFSGFLYLSFATIDNKLCLAISFNEQVYSKLFIHDLKQMFLELIEDLII